MNIEIGGPGAPTRRIKNLRLVSRGDDGPRVFPGDGDGDDDRGSRDDGDGGGDNDGDGVSLLNIKKSNGHRKARAPFRRERASMRERPRAARHQPITRELERQVHAAPLSPR